MAWYQADLDQGKLSSIVVADGLPYAMQNDAAILMLPAENLQWTEVFSNRIKALETQKGSVWVLGMPSEATSNHLTDLGWKVVTTENNEDLASLYSQAD